MTTVQRPLLFQLTINFSWLKNIGIGAPETKTIHINVPFREVLFIKPLRVFQLKIITSHTFEPIQTIPLSSYSRYTA